MESDVVEINLHGTKMRKGGQQHAPAAFTPFSYETQVIPNGTSSQTPISEPRLIRKSAWSENCKWYNSLPLGAVISLFYEPV
jgi:hypothetical protein